MSLHGKLDLGIRTGRQTDMTQGTRLVILSKNILIRGLHRLIPPPTYICTILVYHSFYNIQWSKGIKKFFLRFQVHQL